MLFLFLTRIGARRCWRWSSREAPRCNTRGFARNMPSLRPPNPRAEGITRLREQPEETQLFGAHPPQKKPHHPGAPGSTRWCGGTKRSGALSSPHTHTRDQIPHAGKKKKLKKRSLLFREGGRSENWNGGKIHHHPTPKKISCPKRSEVGAPPPYRSIRLNFRKCPLISIYFNENFGSS